MTKRQTLVMQGYPNLNINGTNTDVNSQALLILKLKFEFEFGSFDKNLLMVSSHDLNWNKIKLGAAEITFLNAKKLSLVPVRK